MMEDNELWSLPSDFGKPHPSALQHSRTGLIVTGDTQQPVAVQRFNGSGVKTAVRGIPVKPA